MNVRRPLHPYTRPSRFDPAIGIDARTADGADAHLQEIPGMVRRSDRRGLRVRATLRVCGRSLPRIPAYEEKRPAHWPLAAFRCALRAAGLSSINKLTMGAAAVLEVAD